MHTTIIHSSRLDDGQRQRLLDAISGDLAQHAGHYRIHHSVAVTPETLSALREALQLDINTLPEGFEPQRVKLVISDMDSTFINIECIDEIADFAGKKPEVSRVTEAAMRGELNFEQSLTQRVALLEGVHTDALQKVYDERLRLNPGAEALLTGLHGQGIRFALVSGGFTFFTDRLKERYRLDYTRSNTLEHNGDHLTGKVVGTIVGAEVKRAFMLELCEQLRIDPMQVIAMGDGANDLPMMKEAGLGVAYRAKPKVQQQADCAISHGGLDAVLDFIG